MAGPGGQSSRGSVQAEQSGVEGSPSRVTAWSPLSPDQLSELQTSSVLNAVLSAFLTSPS